MSRPSKTSKSKYYAYGVVIGRFQPFHNGHLRYLQEALKRCEHLYIGITTPGKTPTQYEPDHPGRLGVVNNPFTYKERVEMISRALSTQGGTLERISFVHFDPANVDAWHKEVPKDAAYFLLLIGDEQQKVDAMRAQGLHVEVLETISDRTYTSGEVRKRMQKDGNWQELVPSGVADYLSSINAVQRLKTLS